MIQIDLLVPMPRLKPENRLLIMCHLGLHFLTSSSPALARVATQAGVNSVCEKEYAWLINFNRLLKDPDFAHNEIVRGENYVRDNHSKATTQQVGFVRSIGDGLINVQRQLFFPCPLPQEKMLPKKRCSESGHFSPDFTRLTSSRTLGEL